VDPRTLTCSQVRRPQFSSATVRAANSAPNHESNHAFNKIAALWDDEVENSDSSDNEDNVVNTIPDSLEPGNVGDDEEREETKEENKNIQRLPAIQGLSGRKGKLLRESAIQMEKLPSTMVFHKRKDTMDTSGGQLYDSIDSCKKNPPTHIQNH
jgi:hypothetical protein